MLHDSYFTLSFIARKVRAFRNGEYPIFARISVSGQVAEMNIGRSVVPANWDQKRAVSTRQTDCCWLRGIDRTGTQTDDGAWHESVCPDGSRSMLSGFRNQQRWHRKFCPRQCKGIQHQCCSRWVWQWNHPYPSIGQEHRQPCVWSGGRRFLFRTLKAVVFTLLRNCLLNDISIYLPPYWIAD